VTQKQKTAALKLPSSLSAFVTTKENSSQPLARSTLACFTGTYVI
jgi:hypothetical protein